MEEDGRRARRGGRRGRLRNDGDDRIRERERKAKQSRKALHDFCLPLTFVFFFSFFVLAFKKKSLV